MLLFLGHSKSLTCHPEYFGVYSLWYTPQTRFKTTHLSPKTTKSRVQSQVCYLHTTHYGVLTKGYLRLKCLKLIQILIPLWWKVLKYIVTSIVLQAAEPTPGCNLILDRFMTSSLCLLDLWQRMPISMLIVTIHTCFCCCRCSCDDDDVVYRYFLICHFYLLF